MTTFFVVLGFMLLIMAAMAIGVIAGRKPIAGSCGGLNKLGLKEGCDICGGKDEVCEEENRKRNEGQQASARRRSDESRGADLGYDATKR
ncbi:(Na+)-NQR maturation NqrM [Billgrantia saliphila]|uniref:(Na+)-NQR maturation NqrM n=1 Tax=Billgrantia saliphila TaxID=1848458 RepID=UPI000CE2CC52|nr:(Na+)-NQR maturation NqrM [Halomonas saliphila]